MNLTYYVRPNSGIKTHVENLLKYFQAKIVNPKWIRFPGDYYHIDKDVFKLKKELENSDIFHIHHPATSSECFVPRLLRKVKNKPKIVNTFHIQVGFSRFSFITNTYLKFIGKIYDKVSSAYIVVGELQKKILESVVNREIHVIPNGVDTRVFKKMRAHRYFDDFTVGYLGRLSPEKNIVSLIKACKKLNVNLVIAGKGVLYKKIKKMESNSIKILGYIENPVEFYNSIDVFALPSYLEGHPYTVIEAMACERPVIVSNFGGNEKDIEECGIICSPHVSDIMRAIREIERLDLHKLGKRAREIVEEKYNLEKQIEAHRKIYKNVAE